MLRTRRSRREDLTGDATPEPQPMDNPASYPEADLLLAESVGLALLVVLERLAPAERVAFVLHDLFDLPFGDIAPVLGRSEPATRQLASRARRLVKGQPADDSADLTRRRHLVDAFLAASRNGDFDALLALLDPQVTLRADRAAAPPAGTQIQGATVVASGALGFSHRVRFAQPALLDGGVGVVVAPGGQLRLALLFIVRTDSISEIDVVADPHHLERLTLAILPD